MIPKKPALGLDPRVGTGFRKRSCSNKELKRDDDSKKSHLALRNRLPQDLARWLGSIKRTQGALLDPPALRRTHEMPAICRDAMDTEALRRAVIGHLDRIPFGLRDDDRQIGSDDSRVAGNCDVGEPGEMRKPARNRRLMVRADHLLRDGLASARARKRFPAVEHSVFHPARRDMGIAPGVGARWMARNHIVDFEPVLDGSDPLFQTRVGRHLWLHCNDAK